MSASTLFRTVPGKRLVAGLILGAMLYLGFLLALAPASLAAWAAAHFSHQRMRLQGVSGSLWHGSANIINVSGPGGQAYQLTSLTWKIGFSQLLHGQLLAEIKVGQDATASQAVIAVSRHQLQLKQFHSPLPAFALKAMVPQLDISKVPGGKR